MEVTMLSNFFNFSKKTKPKVSKNYENLTKKEQKRSTLPNYWNQLDHKEKIAWLDEFIENKGDYLDYRRDKY